MLLEKQENVLLPQTVLVTTADGPLVGRALPDGSRSWLGIPYAAPPTGSRRFAPPAPPLKWDTPRNATVRGHLCPQAESILGTAVIGNEDCLFLDVYAPPPPPGATPSDPPLLPVLAFIPGGSFVIGDASSLGQYAGDALAAATGALVVVLQYRLGALGFLAHAALMAEPSSRGAANFGLQDQRSALTWLRLNAAAFGGDGRRVSVMGQSAGGMSVCALVASPAAVGLFTAAAIQSAACDTDQVFQPLSAALEQGDAFASARGCPLPAGAAGAAPTARDPLPAVAACLRDLPLAQLMRGQLDWPADGPRPPLAPLLPWTPVVDASPFGVPAVPTLAIRAGAGSRVPLLIGTVLDEGSIFAPLGSLLVGRPPPLTPALLEEVAEAVFPGNGARILAAYPGNATGAAAAADSSVARLRAIVRDGIFRCPSRRAAAAAHAAGNDVYLYSFEHPLQWRESTLGGLGDYHSCELAFLFRNYPPWRQPDFADVAVERVMAG